MNKLNQLCGSKLVNETFIYFNMILPNEFANLSSVLNIQRFYALHET